MPPTTSHIFKTDAPVRLLVTGAQGQLGRELARALHRVPAVDVIYASRHDLDITDRRAVLDFVGDNRFSHIINCAAYTAVDQAETDIQTCRRVNVDGPLNLGLATADTDCRIIHLSTDFVFDGTSSTPYSPSDATNPLSVYGQSKLDGEKALLNANPDAVIVRTAWLYSAFGHNFLNTVLRLGRQGTPMRVVDDQTGTPTYAADLALALVAVIMHPGWQPGIYHYANKGHATWYDFASAIAEEAKLSIPITPCTTAQYNAPARRPAYSVLDSSKITKTYRIDIPDWRDALRRCLVEHPSLKL